MKSSAAIKLEPDLFDLPVETPVVEKDDERIHGEEKIKNAFVVENLYIHEGFFLKTEAMLLQLAYAHNKILSLSNSRTSILAHQVESTHRIVAALNKRFLIADEVGLGKTVEAGLVIKELMYRYQYKRVLITCPASLLFQWQNEMQSKFNESFTIMDRRVLLKAARTAGEGNNPWDVHDKIICSIDFIKNKAFAEDIARTKWDMVVFDEAHRLRRDGKQSTIAYNAAEIISKKTEAMLLLSATPFRGKLEELYYLIALLDEDLLGPFNSFYNEYCLDSADLTYLKQKISQVVIRRTKKEVGGFTLRHAKTIRFDLYPDERLLYDETTQYVIDEFNRALQTENRAIGFVMTVFQKLLDSSTYALLIALRNRDRKLSKLISSLEHDNSLIDYFFETVDDDILDEETADEMTNVSIEKTVEELKVEVATIRKLIKIAEKIDVNKKGEKLQELIRGMKKKGSKKFLIFTQFRTTQDYLADLLSEYDVVVFNGSMDRDEKEQAIIDFKERAEVLIATEAGGEGRNMQFCNVLINYDLPWSPLKIEQRIGRIHRFGQPYDVYIFNFSTSDTVAERVLEVLQRKLKLFEDSIGTPDIMLGQIEDELKLNNLFMEMAAGKRSKKDIDGEMDARIAMAKQSYAKLADLTVTDRMDFNYDQYYEITLKERQFCNKRIERFICSLQKIDDYATQFIGKKHSRNNLFPMKKNNSTGVQGAYGTFDSQTALENDNLEFLAFGHPIVDDLIAYTRSDAFPGLIGVRLLSYDRPFIGFIVNYVVTFESVEKTSGRASPPPPGWPGP